MKTKRVLYWVTIVFLSAVILVCGVLIAQKLIDDARNRDYYESMSATKPSVDRPSIPDEPIIPTTESTEPSQPTEPGETTEPSTAPTEPSILFELQMSYAINNDLVGWMEIPGTKINYPVVQSPYEANFYLRKNILKEKATCGTLYVREACDVFKPSDNVTIYGHKMRDGTMFADLHKYKQKTFWQNNKYIYFDTLYERHTYEIFAVFNTTADLSVGFSYHIFDDARDQTDFDKFVAKCKDLSLYDTGITPQYGEKLITLSTCDKDVDIEDARFVVVARRLI